MSGKAIKFTLFFIVFSFILALAAILLNYTFKAPRRQQESAAFASEGAVRVIVDAGHGGRDGGASSADGQHEKELNLEMARIVSDLLYVSGVDVVMTRTDDYMLDTGEDISSNKMRDLKGRLKISEDNPGAVFLSLHMNIFPDKRYYGLQVYYSKNDAGGKLLAKQIQSLTCQYLQPENKREVKAAGSNIYILDRIKNPAVLVECGFLSNPEEAALLADEIYRHKLALVICGGVLNYLNEQTSGNNEAVPPA